MALSVVPKAEHNAALRRIGELEAEVEACKRHHEKSIVKCRERLEGAVEDRDHFEAALDKIAGWATGTGRIARTALATRPSTPEDDD